MAIIEQSEGPPIAILNRTHSVFYAVPATIYEVLMDKIEDMELAKIVNERLNQLETEVSLNEL